MRYLITSTKSSGRAILGYDINGHLCEVKVEDMPNVTTQDWFFRYAPFYEAELDVFRAKPHLKVELINVSFDEFWKAYDLKEGKKDAMKAWERMSEASRQQAFSYLQRYKGNCHRDRKIPMYPATYLRAERWIDHT